MCIFLIFFIISRENAFRGKLLCTLLHYFTEHIVGLSVLADIYLTVADELLAVVNNRFRHILDSGRRGVRFGAHYVNRVEYFLIALSIGLVNKNKCSILVLYMTLAAMSTPITNHQSQPYHHRSGSIIPISALVHRSAE